MKGSSTVRAIAITVAVALCITLAAWAALPGTTIGALPSGIPAPTLALEEAAEAEARYAPILVLSTGERTLPVAVDHFIANCHLTSPQGTVLEHPGPDELGGEGTSSYALDHEGGGIGDAGAIAVYEAEGGRAFPAVYVRTAEVEGKVIIQYWLFYVFNQGTYNSHEGDWEMVQVILDREAMAPESLTLSRHHIGSRTPWGSLGAGDLNGTHPMVLVSRGSHANYLPSTGARDLGDVADGGGPVLQPSDYTLISLGRAGDAVPPPSWLSFQGTWGERTAMGSMLGTDGPPGPMFRENGRMWSGLRWGW